MDTLVGILGSGVVSGVTALLSMRWALRRFRSERWWERKAESYSCIVEALFELSDFYGVSAEDNLTQRERPPEEEAKMKAAYEVHHDELKRVTGMGAYIISDKAAKVLNDLEAEGRQNHKDAQCAFEWYDAQGGAYLKALNEMRRLAKEDLGVR